MFHFIVAVFIALHAVDGVEIYINIDEIAILRPNNEAAKGKPNELIVTGARCTVGLTNGKYFGVTEGCDEVQKLIDRAQTQPR